jgi:hypothetical protein
MYDESDPPFTEDPLWSRAVESYVGGVIGALKTSSPTRSVLCSISECFAKELLELGLGAHLLGGGRPNRDHSQRGQAEAVQLQELNQDMDAEMPATALHAQAKRNAQEGSWMQLFDPEGTFFIDNDAFVGFPNFDSGSPATAYYQHNLMNPSEQLRNNDRRHSELCSTVTEHEKYMSQLENCRRAVSGIYPQMEPAEATLTRQKRLFVTRVLKTACAWDLTVTYGDFMKQAFVLLVYLKEATKDVGGSIHGLGVTMNTFKWDTRHENFVNKLGVVLIHCAMLGPSFNKDNFKRDVRSFYTKNNPLYQYVVIPLLQMTRVIFPLQFDFAWILTEHSNMIKHVKNARDQVNNWSVFDTTTAIELARGNVHSVPFLKGMFYAQYQVLFMVCEMFRGCRDRNKDLVCEAHVAEMIEDNTDIVIHQLEDDGAVMSYTKYTAGLYTQRVAPRTVRNRRPAQAEQGANQDEDEKESSSDDELFG